MTIVTRVLPLEPVADLAAAIAAGCGQAIEAARASGGDAVLATVADAGLRGRGGAGFSTGAKWKSVVANRPADDPLTVIVNAAEGEPGTWKDHAIVRADPYRVIEGALIAATVVGADRVVVATKAAFIEELARLRSAVEEVAASDLAGGIALEIVEGPSSYLFGEETGLLEVVDGRPPLPRVSVPWQQGVEVNEPTLINNVETLANVPGIVLHGPAWFREHGTKESPGTLVATLTGRVHTAGVVEVAMGTTLRWVIEEVAGGVLGDHVVAVLNGAASAPIPVADLDTPLTYEDMKAIGSGLGSASFIVLDDETDVAAVAAGVARFLAVESCGQCTPCKTEGLALAAVLDGIRSGNPDPSDMEKVHDHLRRVVDRARCPLAGQQETVVGRLVELFPGSFTSHIEGRVPGSPAFPVIPVVGFAGGQAILDEHQLEKQPDWTYDAVDSGTFPAARFSDPDAARATASAGDEVAEEFIDEDATAGDG
ncbi:MAG: NADH-ubiquinone oxidoreductase-F iron-sulfur binding region domain-containing protein [Acidimicrobiales bacterium]